MSLIVDHPQHQIYIGIRKIGKEKVLVDLAKRIQERILVSEDKYQMLSLMEYPDVFTTDPNESRFVLKKLLLTYVVKMQFYDFFQKLLFFPEYTV